MFYNNHIITRVVALTMASNPHLDELDIEALARDDERFHQAELA